MKIPHSRPEHRPALATLRSSLSVALHDPVEREGLRRALRWRDAVAVHHPAKAYHASQDSPPGEQGFPLGSIRCVVPRIRRAPEGLGADPAVRRSAWMYEGLTAWTDTGLPTRPPDRARSRLERGVSSGRCRVVPLPRRVLGFRRGHGRWACSGRRRRLSDPSRERLRRRDERCGRRLGNGGGHRGRGEWVRARRNRG